MEELQLVSPCHFGLESVLAGELRRMGANDVQAQDGRVFFKGDSKTMICANLSLRTAERVLIVVGESQVYSFDNLFEATKALPWENWIGVKDQFPVKGKSIRSKLHSVPDCQSIIKKAVVERLKTHYHTSWFEETGSLHQIQFIIQKDKVTLMLDTSGTPLFKRGYRANASIAPIRETLAAGILDLARVRTNTTLYDPFCGSGTFLIEAAMKVCNMPPGLTRKFSAQYWRQIPMKLWQQEREALGSEIREDVSFHAYGMDKDKEMITLTQDNAKKADVKKLITLQTQDILEFSPSTPDGVVVCNPPYGERMMQSAEVEALYVAMGKAFVPREGFSYYIITPHEGFEALFGRKADKKRKLYNGMIKCNLYMYFK